MVRVLKGIILSLVFCGLISQNKVGALSLFSSESHKNVPKSENNSRAPFSPEQQKVLQEIVKNQVNQEMQRFFKHLQESIGIAVMVAREAADKETRQEAALKTHQNTLFQKTQQPFVGTQSAHKAAIIFTDPYCVHCHQALDAFEKYAGAQKDVKLIIHNYPLFGRGSKDAVEAFLAAHLQKKYQEFYKAFRACFDKEKKTLQKKDLLRLAKEIGLDLKRFEKDLTGEAVKNILKETIGIGKDFNITGTPTFIVQHLSAEGQKGQVKEGVISPQECFETGV